MDSIVQKDDLIVRKGLSRKEVHLNRVTHMVMVDLKTQYWEGDKMLYQCSFSVNEQELSRKVFELESCRYRKTEFFKDGEVVALPEAEEYVRSKEFLVQKLLNRYNAKTGRQVQAEIQYSEDIGVFCFYFKEVSISQEWLYRCSPIVFYIQHKEPEKCVLVKQDDKVFVSEIKKFLEQITYAANFEKNGGHLSRGKEIFRFMVTMFLFLWSAIASILRLVVWSIIWECFMGKDPSMERETSIIVGLIFTILWVVFVTLPTLFCLKLEGRYGKSLQCFTVGVIVLISLLFVGAV